MDYSLRKKNCKLSEYLLSKLFLRVKYERNLLVADADQEQNKLSNEFKNAKKIPEDLLQTTEDLFLMGKKVLEAFKNCLFPIKIHKIQVKVYFTMKIKIRTRI